MRRAVWSVVVLALLMLWPTSVEARPGRDRIVRLKAAVAEVLRRHRVPGVGLALVDRDGVIWAGGVGSADVEGLRPVGDDTLFRVASITKSFVSLAAVSLHAQGRVDLDAPVAPLLPDVEIGNRWRDEAPITLAHLLEHTSGFDDMHLNEFWDDGADELPLAEVLARNPRSRVARWRPGSRFSYANPGYTVAAALLEQATKQRYQDVVAREVLAPLGITDAHFGLRPELTDRLSDGHDHPERAVPYQGIYHHPAGALITSPAELAKLVHHWVVRSDAIVGEELLARVERGSTLPYPTTDVDYGLGNHADLLHPIPCRGHDGGLPGFASSYRYCPDAGVGYVMLLNATYSARAYIEIRMLLFQALTEGREFPEPPRGQPSEEELRQAAGFYNFANPRHGRFGFIERLVSGVNVVRRDGTLVLRPLTGGQIGLVPTTDGGFRFPHDGGTSVRFTRNGDGEEIMLIYGAYFERGQAWLARLKLAAVQLALKIFQAAIIVFALWLMLWLATPAIGRAVRPAEVALLAPPALAGATLIAAILLAMGASVDILKDRNGITMAVCGLTVAFAMFSGLGMAMSIAAIARDRLGPDGAARSLVRLWALIASATAFAFTLWLVLNGMIGFKSWDY